MKKVSVILLLVFILTSCNNNDNGVKLLEEQQNMLSSQVYEKFALINELYFMNNEKYRELKKSCDKISHSVIFVTYDFQNNTEEIDKVLFYYKQCDYYNTRNNPELLETVKETLSSGNKYQKTYAINNFLIIVDNVLHNEITKNLRKGIHYSNTEPYAELIKHTFKFGEEIKVNLFKKVTDTTQKSKFIIEGNVIDSFDRRGNAVYITNANKVGKSIVNGKMIYIKDNYKLDTSNFKFEYFVKH